jgi:two-component system phosphate regulon response regulator PhoB
MPRILIFEDDVTSMFILSTCLNEAGHQVQEMNDACAVEKTVREFEPDIVITDIMMPGFTGSHVYQIIRQKFGPKLPVLVSSATGLRVKNTDDPLLAHCPKPIDAKRLLETVHNLVSAETDGSDSVRR